jgi:hypothetical protein
MTTTIIMNTYSNGIFRSTQIVGTFDKHDDAEKYLTDHVLYNDDFNQIAPCGYERLDANGKRFQHVIITGSNTMHRDINGRWERG